MAELPPVVLSGPFLRNCEDDDVAIWFATSVHPRTVTMSLATVAASHNSRSLGALDENTTTVQLGVNLWITLHRARPSGGRRLPPETLITYDIWIHPESTAPFSLLDAVVGGRKTLTYGSLPGPTFFLPGPYREALTFAFGSCRKLHGRGVDMTEGLDGYLQQKASDLRARPSLLALNGDQVYADDVHRAILECIHRWLPRIVGYKETLPAYGKRHEKYFQPGNRQIPTNSIGFTSSDAASHVFHLGEYVLLYLIYWNEGLWPASFDSPFADAALRDARRALPAFRRVLANCPTYMIFDDHEVTDDWNLDRAWRRSAERTPQAKRVVANALAAYAVFQAWGNDPKSFPEQIIWTVQDHVKWLMTPDRRFESSHAGSFEDAMWSFDRWSFSTPSQPPIFFVDTRTQRDFSKEYFPRLIGHAELRRLGAMVKRRRVPVGGTLVLSLASPVYGIPSLESLQEWTHRYERDHENWMVNVWSYIDLMSYIVEELRPAHCLFISGDVHYAFNVDVAYTQTRGHRRTSATPGLWPLRVHQLTSSAIKNAPTSTESQALRKLLPRLDIGMASYFEGENRAAVWHPEGGGDPTGPTTPPPFRSATLTTPAPLFFERHHWIMPSGAGSHIVPGSNIALVTIWPRQKRVQHGLISGRRAGDDAEYWIHLSELR